MPCIFVCTTRGGGGGRSRDVLRSRDPGVTPRPQQYIKMVRWETQTVYYFQYRFLKPVDNYICNYIIEVFNS